MPTVLSVEEVVKILEISEAKSPLGYRNKALLELIYGSGLRVSELLDIRMSDVHLSERYVVVQGKGGKERIVPISDMAITALRKYMTDARPKLIKKPLPLPYLFINNEEADFQGKDFIKSYKDLQMMPESKLMYHRIH